MAQAPDKSDKPYSLDDLEKAMGDWKVLKAKRVDFERQRDAKRGEMDSFQREADKAAAEETRYEAVVRKILKNMEK